MDNGASEMPPLLAQVDDLLARIAARPAAMDQNTFVGRHYVRYFAEIKRRNLVEPFVYWVLQRAPVNGVRDWLTSHRPRVQEFIDFTKSYEWPRP